MNTITYQFLNQYNFNEYSLDNFIRTQHVTHCWRKNDCGELALVPENFTEDWDLARRREIAKEILTQIDGNGFAYGAFCGGEVVGYISVSGESFGSRNQYVELNLFHVSQPYRGRGIGRELFILACDSARSAGAQKLYISAHPSMESQAVYRKLGCVEAEEVNKIIAENEPFDVQMEFQL